MPDANDPPPTSESRPVDLGLSEGKSMGFAPTSALRPATFPIGGLSPVAAAQADAAAPPAPGPQASAPAAASSSGAPSSGESS